MTEQQSTPDAVPAALAPRDEVRADQRRRLLDAMYEIACRDGLHAARIQDIAREARVSLRTFYAEFESKEECFLALHLELSNQVRELLAGALDFTKPWKEIMRDGFTAYFTELARQPMLTRAITVELATLSDAARERREQTMQGYADMLVGLVEFGRSQNPDGLGQPLSPLTARALVGSMTELINSHVYRNEVETIVDIADTLTEMLWRLVMFTEPAAGGAPSAGATT